MKRMRHIYSVGRFNCIPSKIKNQNVRNLLVLSEFKCRGKLFVEASEKDIESLKNQNDNFKWFV